ncbi:hypothetical protein H6S82_31075 [Planktothrix sp. FACHB-1355]|uniref:Uncharacterized protein n=2 Tax=Cyanophyceae TaxID=3028117 RepID=A0A926VIL6_9CYAN|nr:hypothetical protein [Aerosakkonema funiforme FACHB-1375]MBD3563248.1 hypothetical protein [Planktothrix sp. FACHB-1355]
MKSLVVSESISVTQNDVLYVAQQLTRDLKALSKAYPNLLSIDYASDLQDSFTTFLYNNAITELGFSIYDPANSNLVYHEYRYKVLYGGDVVSVNPSGGRGGRGGRSVEPVSVPSSALFIPWVKWSQTMMLLSEDEQRNIVIDTGWSIPGKGSSFQGKYEGGNWSNLGHYYSGSLGVSGLVYVRET